LAVAKGLACGATKAGMISTTGYATTVAIWATITAIPAGTVEK